jgi:NTP pyrophosphatase (non-canonical NTP hydrolase)
MQTEQEKVLLRAWNTFGPEKQLDMLVEECAELIQAVNKLKRADDSSDEEFDKARLHLAQEIADVGIMIDQVSKGMLIDVAVALQRGSKIVRLAVRLDEFDKKNLETSK